LKLLREPEIPVECSNCGCDEWPNDIDEEGLCQDCQQEAIIDRKESQNDLD